MTRVSYEEIGIPPSLRRPATWSLWAMVLLAAASLLGMIRRRLPRPSGPAFVWIVPVLMLASVVWITGFPRFRAPADPFLMLLAAPAAIAIIDAARERWRRRLAGPPDPV